MIKTEVFEKHEIEEAVYHPDKSNLDKSVTDVVTRDQIIERINTYLNDEPLNIGMNEYCYVKVVRNHLEIGRAKISLDE